jgi:hypothetical protein
MAGVDAGREHVARLFGSIQPALFLTHFVDFGNQY